MCGASPITGAAELLSELWAPLVLRFGRIYRFSVLPCKSTISANEERSEAFYIGSCFHGALAETRKRQDDTGLDFKQINLFIVPRQLRHACLFNYRASRSVFRCFESPIAGPTHRKPEMFHERGFDAYTSARAFFTRQPLLPWHGKWWDVLHRNLSIVLSSDHLSERSPPRPCCTRTNEPECHKQKREPH